MKTWRLHPGRSPPRLSPHAVDQPARNRQAQSHAVALILVLRKAEEVVENFHLEFRRNSRPVSATLSLIALGTESRQTAPLHAQSLSYAAPLPHMRLSMQPYGPAARRVFGSILQKIRNHPLYLGVVKREFFQFLIGQEVESKTLLLKTLRPHATNIRKASVEISNFIVQLDVAGFEHAEGQKILDEMLQPMTTRVHVTEHFALAVVQWAQFFAAQQFDIPIHDRQWCFQVVCGRGQGVGGPGKALAKLGVFLCQFFGISLGREVFLQRLLGRPGRSFRIPGSGDTAVFRWRNHRFGTIWLPLRGGKLL